MRNIATINPEAVKALQALGASAEKGGVPAKTLGLVHLGRARLMDAVSVWTCTLGC
jgi:hypothetical protein